MHPFITVHNDFTTNCSQSLFSIFYHILTYCDKINDFFKKSLRFHLLKMTIVYANIVRVYISDTCPGQDRYCGALNISVSGLFLSL